MRNKTNNIETRDKLSKLIQRFDGIEDNNPPTNLIDDKKTGILYTSDYIDKDSYPDAVNPLDNKYEESIVALDKLRRPGEWVYELDLQFRSPITPDYGYGLLNVNDFFTIKKNIYDEICYDAQVAYEICAEPPQIGVPSIEEGGVYFDDPGTPGSTTINLYHIYSDFLTNCDGWEIQSQLLNDYANIPGPYYVNIISGPVFVDDVYMWQIEVVDESGTVVGTIGQPGKITPFGFCLINRSELFIDYVTYPQLNLEVGDTIASADFSLCNYSLPNDIWTIESITPFTQDSIQLYWIITITNENGDRPYFDFNVPCNANICFNKTVSNPTYNNDVRGYIKSIEVIETGCVSPITLLNSIDWEDEESIQQWIQEFVSTGVQYDTLPNQCCPDCNPYIIGNLRDMENLINAYPEFATQCCFNIKASERSFMQFAQGGTIGWYCDNEHNCCDTNFIECADQILSLAPSIEQYFQLLNNGIFEYSSLGGESGLCALYDYIQSIPIEYQEFFLNGILNVGLVIVCNPDGTTTMYSIEAYINSLSPA